MNSMNSLVTMADGEATAESAIQYIRTRTRHTYSRSNNIREGAEIDHGEVI